MRQTHQQWTAERDAMLRAFWDAGHTGTDIANRMGVTKNSVIGRVHRLKLAPRVSPIATITKTWTEEEDNKLRQLYGGFMNVDQIGQKLERSPASVRYRALHLGLVLPRGSAALNSRSSDARRLAFPPSQRVTNASAVPPSARGGRTVCPTSGLNLPGVAPLQALQQRRVFSGTECKYPLWDDERPATYLYGGRRFCAEPVIENAKGCASPYCAAHYAVAYIGTNKDLGEPNKLRWRA